MIHCIITLVSSYKNLLAVCGNIVNYICYYISLAVLLHPMPLVRHYWLVFPNQLLNKLL